MSTIENIDKKYRFVINAVVMSLYIYFSSVVFWNASFFVRFGVGAGLLVVLTFLSHYPNVKLTNLRNAAMVLILPLYMYASLMLALKYYLYLGLIFKMLLMVGASFMFYIISVVDNIFLVVSEREELIPLYRAAVPWSQILLVTLAIPLFAGVYKIPTTSFLQVGIIGFLSFILCIYQFWAYRKEEGIMMVGVGGITLFSLLASFFVISIGIATSFLPIESFVRGLIAASTLMFGLFYVSGFLQNSISKKLLIQYFLIILVFILFSLLF